MQILVNSKWWHKEYPLSFVLVTEILPAVKCTESGLWEVGIRYCFPDAEDKGDYVRTRRSFLHFFQNRKETSHG